MSGIDRNFSGKTVVITGGGNGIGAATAKRFLALGAHVAVIDRDIDGQADIMSVADNSCFLKMQGDCTDLPTLEHFVATVRRHFGEIDILFNNVGQSGREKAAKFIESQEEVWRFVLEISLLSAMRMSRLVAPAMCERRSGRIVNMSSDAAFVGDAGLADYAAAKMGVVGFTRALARELAASGVTVNAVAPGAIRTRAHDRLAPDVLDKIKAGTPAGFIAEPDDVAGVVVFFASDDARYITGQTLLVDGGRWMV